MELKEYLEKRRELMSLEEDLDRKYISSNSKFPLYSNVKYTDSFGGVHHGNIFGYKIMCDGVVNAIVAPLAKNGKPHRTIREYWGQKTMELED